MKNILIFPLFLLAFACQNNHKETIDIVNSTEATSGVPADSTAKWTRNLARWMYNPNIVIDYRDKHFVREGEGC